MLNLGIGKLVSSLLFGNDSGYRMEALNEGFMSIQTDDYQDAARLFFRIKENDPLWMRTISSYGLSLAYALQRQFESAYDIVHNIISITDRGSDSMTFAAKKGTIKEWHVYCEELESVICEELLKKNPKFLRDRQKSESHWKIVAWTIFGIIMAFMWLGILVVFS